MPDSEFDLSFNLVLQKIKASKTDIQSQLNKIKGLTLSEIEIDVKDTKKLDALFKKRTIPVELKLKKSKGLKKEIESIFNFKNLDIAGVVQAELKKAESATKKSSARMANEIANTGRAVGSELLGNSVIARAKEQEAQVLRLLKVMSRLSDATSRPNSGEFFDRMRSDIQSLLGSLGDLEIGTEGAGRALASRFEGISGSSASNLIRSTETIFKELKRIDKLQRTAETRDRQLKKGDTSSQPFLLSSDARGQFDTARRIIGEALNSPDIANSSTFKSILDSQLADFNLFIGQFLQEADRFEKAQNDIIKKISALTAQGIRGDSALGNNLQDQLRLLREGAQQGSSLDDVQGRRSFTALTEQENNLNKLISKSKTAREAVAKVIDTFRLSSVVESEASSLLRVPERITELADAANSNINRLRNSSSKTISEQDVLTVQNTFKANVKNIEDDTRKLNDVLVKLTSKEREFDLAGLNKSRARVEALRLSIEQLITSGSSVSNISNSFQTSLTELDSFANKEKTISRFRVSLDRLRSSLSAGFETDFAGVGDSLTGLESRLDKLFNQGASDREIRRAFSEGAVDARGLDKLNKKIESSTQKLRSLGDMAIDRGDRISALAFNKAGDEFERFSQRVISSSDSTTAKMSQLNSGLAIIQARAKIESEGGFLGSFAKLAGLATKRLASFLLVARGFFLLQDAMTTSITTGIDLEVQFNKLEQVFNKNRDIISDVEGAVDSLSDTVFNLGKNYGIAVNEITKSSRLLAQAGIVGRDLEQSLSSITKAQLGPTFDDINQTTEASIAILNQFNEEASSLEDILGGINTVSSTYAVEAEGIAAAVRKAGGAFNAAGGNIGEFVSAFTILKQETREADEALGTALRNISIRLQRSSIQKKLKDQLGIDFRREGSDLFAGPTEAILRISQALKDQGIQRGSAQFADIIESIAGARQFARLLPLIENFEELREVQQKFASGSGSLDDDAAIAIDTISNKLEQAKAAFTELSTTILESKAVKFLVDSFTVLAKVLNGVVKSFESLVSPILIGGAVVGVLGALRSGLSGLFLGSAGFSPSGPLQNLFGSGGRGFNRGGFVGGRRGPNKDTVPAMLTTGEFVFSRPSVDRIGKENLENLHSFGRNGYNKGGFVGLASRGFNSAGTVPASQVFGKSQALEELSSILAEFGLDVKDELIRSIDFIPEQILREIRPSANNTTRKQRTGSNTLLRGFAARSGDIRINSELDQRAKKETLSHEIVHIISDKFNSDNKNRRDDIIARSQGSLIDQYTRGRGASGAAESFADIGSLAIARRQRQLSDGTTRSEEIPQFQAILDALDSDLNDPLNSILDETVGILEQQGLRIKDAIDISRFGSETSSAGLTKALGTGAFGRGSVTSNLVSDGFGIGSGGGNNSIGVGGAGAGGAGGFFRSVKNTSKSFISLTGKVTSLAAVFGGLISAAVLTGDSSDNASEQIANLTKAVSSSVLTFTLLNTILKRQVIVQQLQAASSLSKTAFKFLGKGSGLASFGRVATAAATAKTPQALGTLRSAASGTFGGRNAIRLGRTAALAGSGLIKVVSALGPTVAAVGAVKVGLDVLLTSVRKNAEKQLEAAKTAEEVNKAANRLDSAENFQDRISISNLLGGLFKNIGRALGFESSFFSELGPAFSSTVSSVISFGAETLKNVDFLRRFGEGLSNITSAIFVDAEDQARKSSAQRGRRAAALSAVDSSELSGAIADGNAGEAQKQVDEFADNFVSSLRDLSFSTGKQFGEVLNDNAALKKAATDVAESLAAATAAGIDVDVPKNLSNIFESLGISSAVAARNSLIKLDQTFARINEIVGNANSALDAVEGNLQVFEGQVNSILDGSPNLNIPDQVFQLLEKGLDPNSFGLGQFNDRINSILSQNSAFTEIFSIDFGIRKLTTELNKRIAAGADSIIIRPNEGRLDQALVKTIEDLIPGTGLGNSVVSDLFTKFLEGNAEDIIKGTAGVQADEESGTGAFQRLDVQKLRDFVNRFAETNGQSVELLKRRIQIEDRFTSKYANLLQKRLQLENRVIDQLNDGLNAFQRRVEFDNKVNDFNNPLNREQQGRRAIGQARAFDRIRLGNNLKGTGLGRNASIADILNRFRQSQAITQNAKRNGREGQLDVIFEKGVQDRLTKALSQLAEGGESLKVSLENFDNALQESRKAADFFRGTLLGSDKQIIDTAKGFSALNQILGAQSQSQARLLAIGLSDNAKSGLSSILSSNSDLQAQFDKAVGATFNAGILPENKAVNAEFDKQQEAQKALIEVTKLQINAVDNLNKNLQNNEAQALQGFINQFADVGNKLANQMANIPNEIKHNHVFPDLNVNFNGAANLEKLQEGFKNVIESQIKAQITKFEDGLIKNNNGLRRGL